MTRIRRVNADQRGRENVAKNPFETLDNPAGATQLAGSLDERLRTLESGSEVDRRMQVLRDKIESEKRGGR